MAAADIARGAAVSAVLLVCACASPPPAPVLRSRTEPTRPAPAAAAAAAERAMLSRYAKERDCEGAAYARARDYAAARLDALASAPTEAGRIPQAVGNGQFRVRLAEAAARKRCFEQARRAFGEVIDVFTGPPYAALRRRALDGLAKTRPPAAGPA